MFIAFGKWDRNAQGWERIHPGSGGLSGTWQNQSHRQYYADDRQELNSMKAVKQDHREKL